MKLTSAKQILSVAVLLLSCYCPPVIAQEVSPAIIQELSTDVAQHGVVIVQLFPAK
jgi:hypothetical protein